MMGILVWNVWQGVGFLNWEITERKLFTICAKRSILDVWQGSEYTSGADVAEE